MRFADIKLGTKTASGFVALVITAAALGEGRLSC